MSDLNKIIQEFYEGVVEKLKYSHEPAKYEAEVKFVTIPSAAKILGEFEHDIRPYAEDPILKNDYVTILSTIGPDSSLYKLAVYDFNQQKFLELYEQEGGEGAAEEVLESARLDVDVLHEVLAELVHKLPDA